MKKVISILLISLMLLTSCNTNNTEEPKEEPKDDPKEEVIPEQKPDLPPSTPPEEEKVVHGNVLDYLDDEYNVPLIKITTENKTHPADKENYVKGELEIVESGEESTVIFEKASMGIRLRGNSTLDCPKKAYRIKFDEKQSLFGLPKAKSWVLLANYYDKSNLRNYLAYLTANRLDNLDFQPSSIFVEVEFNGAYKGLYLLCEQMQTGTGRVDIEQDEYDDNNGSYFFELDFLDRIQADGLIEGVSYFGSNGLYYALKYPEDEDATIQRCTYIKNFMDEVFRRIKAKDNYQSVMDVDSFIDYYLIQELFKNVDGNQSSVYYYVKDKKLYAGPVWDFDLGLNVVGRNQVDATYDYYASSTYWIRDNGYMYQQLFKDPSFLNKVKERYTEVRDILFKVFEEIEIAEEYLSDEFKKNESVWTIPGYLNTWVAQRFSLEYLAIKNTTNHIIFLKKELTKQFYYLDKAYLLY